MEDKLIETLETLGYPIIRQGSMAQNLKYPDTFITFWNNEELGESFYDNGTVSVTYNYSVNVYSNNPTTTYTLLKDIRALLKENGWTITTRGYDVGSDEITHIGRGMDIVYLLVN